MAEQPYRVMVDDNYRYMEVEARYERGMFATCARAVVACRQIVDQFLQAEYHLPMTTEDLWQVYTGFGPDPFIVGPEPVCSFSAWEYARIRCREIVVG